MGFDSVRIGMIAWIDPGTTDGRAAAHACAAAATSTAPLSAPAGVPACQADVLTNTPLDEVPLLFRLLASAVKNCASVEVVLLDVPLVSDEPNADSRFLKSLSSVLAVEEVEAVLVVSAVDVLLVLDVSD